MLLTVKGHPPELVIVRSRSVNEPIHTLPKSPLFEITVAMFCWIPLPLTASFSSGTAGSLLEMVNFDEIAPVMIGANPAVNGKQKFEPSVIGYPEVGSVTSNCVLVKDWML